MTSQGHEVPAPRQDFPEGLSRDEYFAERQLLLGARQRSYQRADQMVIGGATGALLLSITFLEKIAPSPVVTRPPLLVCAWVVLLVCLSASLFGQYSSARAFDCEIARLEALIHGEAAPTNRWAVCQTLSSGTAAILLVAGISLLALFAFLNAPFR